MSNQPCVHGNKLDACSWCDLRDDGGLPESQPVAPSGSAVARLSYKEDHPQLTDAQIITKIQDMLQTWKSDAPTRATAIFDRIVRIHGESSAKDAEIVRQEERYSKLQGDAIRQLEKYEAEIARLTAEHLEALKSEGQKDEWIEMLSQSIRSIVVAASGNDDWEGSVADGIDLLNEKFQSVNQALEAADAARLQAEQRLEGLKAEHEAARLRAYRQARIFEPSMDGYHAAMSTYAAAFGKPDGEPELLLPDGSTKQPWEIR